MIPLPDRPHTASAGDLLGEAPQHHGRKSFSPAAAMTKKTHRASVGDFGALAAQQHSAPHIGGMTSSHHTAHPPSSSSNRKQSRHRLSITRFSASGSSLMGYMSTHHQQREPPAEVIASGYDVRVPDFESMLANDDLVVKVDLDSAAQLGGGPGGDEAAQSHMRPSHSAPAGLLGIGVTTVTTRVEEHIAPSPTRIGTSSSFLGAISSDGRELTEAQKVMYEYTSQAPGSSPLPSNPNSPAFSSPPASGRSSAFPGVTATPSYAAGSGSLRSQWGFDTVPRPVINPGTGFFTIDALDRATTADELDVPAKRSKKSFFRRPSINIVASFSESNAGGKSKRDSLSPAPNAKVPASSASDTQHASIQRSISANNLSGKALVTDAPSPQSARPYAHGGASSTSSDFLHQKQHTPTEHEGKTAYSDFAGSSTSLPRGYLSQPQSAESKYLGNRSASESNHSFPSPHSQRIEDARSGSRSESSSVQGHSQAASGSSSTKPKGRMHKLKTSFGRKASSNKSKHSHSEEDDLRTPAAASFGTTVGGSSGRKSRSRGREAAQDELLLVLAQRHARQASSRLPDQHALPLMPQPPSGFLHRLGLSLDSEKEEMSPTCSTSTTSARTPHSDSRSTFGSSEYSLTTPAGSVDSHAFGSQGHFLSEKRRSSIRSHDPSREGLHAVDARGEEDGKEVMYSPPRPFMDSAQGAITVRPRQPQRPRSRPRTRAGELGDEGQSMPSLPSSAKTGSSDTRSLSSLEAANRSTDSLASSSHSEQRIGRASNSQGPSASQRYPPSSLPSSFHRPPRRTLPFTPPEEPVAMPRKNSDTRSTMTSFAGSSASRRRVKMSLVPTEMLAQEMKAAVKGGHAVLDRDGDVMYIAKRARGLAAGGGVRTVLHRGCATGPVLMRSHQSAFSNFKAATLQRVKSAAITKTGAPWVGSIHRADVFGQRWSFRLPSNREVVRMDANSLAFGQSSGIGLGLSMEAPTVHAPVDIAAAAREEQENGTSFFDLDDADSSEVEGDSEFGDEMLPGSTSASDLGHGLPHKPSLQKADRIRAPKQKTRATSLMEATAHHHPRFAGSQGYVAGTGIITAETNHVTVSAQGIKEGTRVFEWVGAHVMKLVECESKESGANVPTTTTTTTTVAGGGGAAVRDRVVAVFTRDVRDSKGAGELEMDSEFPDTEALILTLLHVLDWHIHGSLKYGA